MYFYVGLFIFCVVMLIINNVIKNDKAKRICEILTLCVLCIISGTRYYLGGTDYYVYQTMFEAVPQLNEFSFSTVRYISGTYGAEQGFLFLCSVVKTIGFNFFGFTMIHSIIFYSAMYIGLKKYTKNFNFLIIIFIYKIFFYNTFISLRQSITIAIFFIALKYIQERKMIKYFVCCIIAATFHNGALLLFPIYFIGAFKLTKSRLILLNLIFIPTIILSTLKIPILSNFQWFINLFSNSTSIAKATNLINSVPGTRYKHVTYF